jgi:D-inositol-3-phosphate glycosyltransferase
VGLELQKHQNLQLLHTYHSLGAIKYRTVANIPAIAQTRLAVEQQILEQAHCVVSTSPQEMADLRNLVSDRGRIEVIPCGTDIDNFQPISSAGARQQLGIDPQAKIVLYVGRFDPRKGIETLVRAYAQLVKRSVDPQNLRLLIVGGSDPQADDGAERQRIEGLVNSLGLGASIEFVGMVGHDRLPLYYTAADVCAIPSHYEPFGLVAIESMACGTPVVASAVGGLKFTVIPEETGLLVPPQDVDGFAQAIERILADDLWARKVGKQAVSMVQDNFSWTGVAVQLSDLYRKILARSIVQPSIMRTAVSSTNLRPQIFRAS